MSKILFSIVSLPKLDYFTVVKGLRCDDQTGQNLFIRV